jgi:rhodanese-related sulfurtransferase
MTDYTDITVDETWNMLTNITNGIQIPIDVRTETEFKDEHIDTPYPENPENHCICEWRTDEYILSEFISTYDGTEIILYSTLGIESSNAADILVNNGFNGIIYNMLGGINNWKQTGYPTIGNRPPEAPIINGPNHGSAGDNYEYSFSIFDPDYDPVYLYVNWSDGTDTIYTDLLNSEEQIILNHTWTKKGTYIIKAKAWDKYLIESNEASFEVTMPYIKKSFKNKISIPRIIQEFEQLLSFFVFPKNFMLNNK